MISNDIESNIIQENEVNFTKNIVLFVNFWMYTIKCILYWIFTAFFLLILPLYSYMMTLDNCYARKPIFSIGILIGYFETFLLFIYLFINLKEVTNNYLKSFHSKKI